MIWTPIGDPYFQDDECCLLKKTLYGLRQYPHHWYNIIKVIILNLGLNPSPYDPCILSGILTNSYFLACTSDLQYQLHIGIYVDDFVFYSSDSAQEEFFKTLIQEQIQVEFIVNVDYLLGIAFNWIQHADVNI